MFGYVDGYGGYLEGMLVLTTLICLVGLNGLIMLLTSELDVVFVARSSSLSSFLLSSLSSLSPTMNTEYSTDSDYLCDGRGGLLSRNPKLSRRVNRVNST